MEAFVTHKSIRINDTEFKIFTTRKLSVEEYKTLKQYMDVVSEEGFMYLYCSEKNREVMEVHLNSDFSICSVELHKGVKDEEEILHVSSSYVLENNGELIRQSTATEEGNYFMFWLVNERQVVTTHNLYK